MKTRRLAGIVAGGAVALTLMILLRSGHADPRPQTRSTRRSDSLAAYGRVPSASQPIVLAGERRDRRRYRVHHHTVAKTHIAGSVAELAIDLAGELSLHVYETGSSPLHGLRFRPLRVTGCDALRPELETETLIRRDAEGRAVSIRFSKRAGAMARNLLRALLAALEVVVPATPAEQWVERGADPTGRFVAEYAILSRSADGTRISRRKRYEELHLSDERGTRVTEGPRFEATTGGQTTILIEPSGGLASLDGHETLELRGGTIGISSVSKTHVALLSIDKEDSPLPDECESVECVGFVPEGMAVGRTPVHGASVDQILEGLTAVLGQEGWRQEAPQSFLTLKAIFEDSEEARAGAQALLRSGAYPPDLLQLVADALGSIPEGAPLLLDLARDGSIFAVHALGLTPQLDDAVVAGLAGLARSSGEIADAALVSLGFAAGIPSNEAKRDGVARELAPLLGRSAERDAQILQALGNAGSSTSLDAVLAQATSDDPEVRASVAVALRRVPGAAAFHGIAKLASDSSYLVRRQAVMVLALRPEPEARALLEQAARNDPHEVVRAQALQSLTSSFE